MKYAGLAVLAALCMAGTARAGAWPQVPGATQVIASYEPASADQGWDAGGNKVPLGKWTDQSEMLFVDHGVTEWLTVTARLTYKTYRTDVSRFSGLSSMEFGGRWTVRHTDRDVLAFGASVEGGKGRRSDFDLTARQGTDTDLRIYAGHNFRFHGIDGFSDIQIARHLRQYDANQWRLDMTYGLKPSPKWMLLGQVFAGESDRQSWGRVQWANAQVSAVRNFGPVGVQLGWRRTLYGRNVPQVNALIVGLWRDF